MKVISAFSPVQWSLSVSVCVVCACVCCVKDILTGFTEEEENALVFL